MRRWLRSQRPTVSVAGDGHPARLRPDGSAWDREHCMPTAAVIEGLAGSSTALDQLEPRTSQARNASAFTGWKLVTALTIEVTVG